jgi:bacterioferritin-associated ferredoxin
MACLVHPEPSAPDGAQAAGVQALFPAPVPPPMTRCECAGVSFEEMARQMASAGASFEEARRRTGCGQTCTACLPDLRRFLASSSL